MSASPLDRPVRAIAPIRPELLPPPAVESAPLATPAALGPLFAGLPYFTFRCTVCGRERRQAVAESHGAWDSPRGYRIPCCRGVYMEPVNNLAAGITGTGQV